jgi:hypothetical protein
MTPSHSPGIEEPRLNAPIFIVGAPRSGTTLLRNMLNRHPAIAICRETEFHRLVFQRRRAFGGLSDVRNRQRLVKQYLLTRRIQRMQMDSRALEQALLREGTSYEAFLASLLRFYAQAHGKKRCGEKTPMHALFTETLCEWYPGAIIIHILRDPRDVVASLLRVPWASQNVLGNAHLWVQCNVAARRSRHRPNYLLVRYEELVAQPELELRHICAFIDEEYSPAMLVPNWDPTAHQPWYRRAEEPVTTERVEKWREQLTANQVSLTEWVVGSHMQTFGYEPAERSPSARTIIRGLASAAFDAARRRAGEFPGLWYSLTGSTHLVKEETATERFRSRQSSAGAMPENCR